MPLPKDAPPNQAASLRWWLIKQCIQNFRAEHRSVANMRNQSEYQAAPSAGAWSQQTIENYQQTSQQLNKASWIQTDTKGIHEAIPGDSVVPGELQRPLNTKNTMKNSRINSRGLTRMKNSRMNSRGLTRGPRDNWIQERMADIMNRMSVCTYKHRPIVQGDRVNSAVTKIACQEKGIDPLALLYLGPTKDDITRS